MRNRGPFMTSFFKVLENSFKVIYCDKTTIEVSTLPAICIFKRSDPIFWLKLQNSGIFVSSVTSLSPNWEQKAQSCISCIEADRKIEINIWWNFEVMSLFLRSFLQNITVLTPVADAFKPKIGSKRTQICISCANDDRKMKVNNKSKFEVKYSFLKALLKNFKSTISKVLTPRGW